MSAFYLSNIAEKDIEKIIEYYKLKNPIVADKFLDSLFKSFKLITDHPHIGHSKKDLTEKPVRFYTFKWHYLIVYQPSNPIEIIRVLSGYQDIISILK